METNKKQKKISIMIYTILFVIIIILGTTLFYLKDMYKEYAVPYDELCYKVEHNEDSMTITIYDNKDDSIISKVDQTYFKDGKMTKNYVQLIHKTKISAKMSYKHRIKQEKEGIIKYGENLKLNKNIIEVTHDLSGEVSYDSEEMKEKFDSFTTNEEIITYLLEEGEKNNFWLSDDMKRIY